MVLFILLCRRQSWDFRFADLIFYPCDFCLWDSFCSLAHFDRHFFSLVFVSLFFLLFLVGASLLHSINSAFSETFLLLFSYINVTTHLPYSRSFQFIFNTIQQHHWRSFNGWCIHNEVMHLEHSNVLCRYSPFHHAAHIHLWAL